MNRLSPLLATAALAIALPAFAQTEPTAIPPEFTRCLDGLRDAARREGVSETTFRFLTRDLAPDMSVIDKLNYQPEFSMPIWDYLSGLVDDERVQQGQAMLQQHAAVLERVQQRFGVDPATVVAVPEVPARRMHVLMLIHIPMRPNSPPRRAGLVLLRHSDGRQSALEIMNVRDVATNWQPDLAAPSARVAWIGVQPTTMHNGNGAGLLDSHVYAVSLDLPPGSAPVSGLRLTIGDGPMEAPLFYAVTLEVGSPREGRP